MGIQNSTDKTPAQSNVEEPQDQKPNLRVFYKTTSYYSRESFENHMRLHRGPPEYKTMCFDVEEKKTISFKIKTEHYLIGSIEKKDDGSWIISIEDEPFDHAEDVKKEVLDCN